MSTATDQYVLENESRFLEELKAWERTQRIEAKDEWRRRREAARREAQDELARMRADIAAERAHGDSILVDFAALKALNAYTGGRFPEMRTRGPITCAPMNPRMKSLKCFAPILI